MPSVARPIVSTLSALALVPCLLGPASAQAFQGEGEETAVLGLEGEGDVAGSLTGALRKQLESRGIQGDKQMTLVELKLTMGCEDDDAGCIAEGGKTLDVDQLIYGSVEGSDDEYTVKLNVLAVEKGKITNGLTTTLAKGDFDAANVDKTAEDLVTRLLGPAPDSGDDEPEAVPEGPEPEETEDPDKGGKIVWGLQKPIPRWKLIGLGVSGGLFAGSLATAIGTTVVIQKPNGRVYKELIQSAEDSLNDDKPENDVDPDMSGDLCEAARVEPNPDEEPGAVTNAAVTKVCNKADALATTATATWITTGVFGAATIVFTVLLFANKEKPAASAMLKRDIRLGGAPTRGGAVFGGGFRF